MTGPEAPAPSGGPDTPWNADLLEGYFLENRGRFTEEALAAAARQSGHSEPMIQAALEGARRQEAGAPVRSRSRRIVLALYLITFLALTAGMIVNTGSSAGAYAVILAMSLGVALAISLVVVNRARPAADSAAVVAGMLAVPIVLLVIVGGLCVMTGLPFRPIAL